MKDLVDFPIDLFVVHRYMLREQLQSFLSELHPLLRADITQALEEPGKLFAPISSDTNSSSPAGMWALLVLSVEQSIAPEIDLHSAGCVAVAVECLICGLDLLDDIEDDDQTPIVKTLDTARTLNVSTALLMLAQRCILSLSSQAVSPDRVVRLMNAFQEATLMSAAGQHREILAESRIIRECSDEECREIAKQKAGSLMRLACLAGAIYAEADDVLCQKFAELGELLGIASQLDNDCHDLYYLLQDEGDVTSSTDVISTTKSVKSDLVRGKKTLPIVLAAQSDASLQQMSLLDRGKKEHLPALREGIVATWGICLLYRERARDCLREIEALQSPISPALRFLLGFI